MNSGIHTFFPWCLLDHWYLIAEFRRSAEAVAILNNDEAAVPWMVIKALYAQPNFLWDTLPTFLRVYWFLGFLATPEGNGFTLMCNFLTFHSQVGIEPLSNDYFKHSLAEKFVPLLPAVKGYQFTK